MALNKTGNINNERKVQGQCHQKTLSIPPVAKFASWNESSFPSLICCSLSSTFHCFFLQCKQQFTFRKKRESFPTIQVDISNIDDILKFLKQTNECKVRTLFQVIIRDSNFTSEDITQLIEIIRGQTSDSKYQALKKSTNGSSNCNTPGQHSQQETPSYAIKEAELINFHASDKDINRAMSSFFSFGNFSVDQHDWSASQLVYFWIKMHLMFFWRKC